MALREQGLEFPASREIAMIDEKIESLRVEMVKWKKKRKATIARFNTSSPR